MADEDPGRGGTAAATPPSPSPSRILSCRQCARRESAAPPPSNLQGVLLRNQGSGSKDASEWHPIHPSSLLYLLLLFSLSLYVFSVDCVHGNVSANGENVGRAEGSERLRSSALLSEFLLPQGLVCKPFYPLAGICGLNEFRGEELQDVKSDSGPMEELDPRVVDAEPESGAVLVNGHAGQGIDVNSEAETLNHGQTANGSNLDGAIPSKQGNDELRPSGMNAYSSDQINKEAGTLVSSELEPRSLRENSSSLAELQKKPNGESIPEGSPLVQASHASVPSESNQNESGKETPAPGEKPSRSPIITLEDFKTNLKENRQGSLENASIPASVIIPPSKVTHDGKLYNYASAVHGAKLLLANKEAKSPSAILDEDKDKYMRNPCSVEDKFFIIELSEKLTSVDSVELANYEFYSSGVKDFEVWGSNQHPSMNWFLIGRFSALNVRNVQFFDLKEAYATSDASQRVAVRFVKFRLLSHHGSEFYCTLSLVRIHGLSEIESLKQEIESMNVESKVVSPTIQRLHRVHTKDIETITTKDFHDLNTKLNGEDIRSAVVNQESNKFADVPEPDPLLHTPPHSGQEQSQISALSAAQTTAGEAEVNGAIPDSSFKERSSLVPDSEPQTDAKTHHVAEAGSSSESPTKESNRHKPEGQESISAESNMEQPMRSEDDSSNPGIKILKVLVSKIRILELNLTLLNSFVDDFNNRYFDDISSIDRELVKTNSRIENNSLLLQLQSSRLYLTQSDCDRKLTALKEEMSDKLYTVSQQVVELRNLVDSMVKRAIGTIIVFLAFLLLLSMWRRDAQPKSSPLENHK